MSAARDVQYAYINVGHLNIKFMSESDRLFGHDLVSDVG